MEHAFTTPGAKRLYQAGMDSLESMGYGERQAFRKRAVESLTGSDLSPDEREATIMLNVEVNTMQMEPTPDEQTDLEVAQAELDANPTSAYQQEKVANIERAMEGDFEEIRPREGVRYLPGDDEPVEDEE